MTKEEIVVVDRWRAEHKLRWWIQSCLKPFMWSVVGLFYRHSYVELRLQSRQCYLYPFDFLFKWNDFERDGKLHLQYFQSDL